MVQLQRETLSNQLTRIIERDIRSGKFHVGSCVPSIRKLADQYKVGVRIVRSAFENLIKKGILVSQERVGVFVNPDCFIPKGRRIISLRSVTDYCDYSDKLLHLHDTRLYGKLQIERLTAPCSTNTLSEFLYELERLRVFNPDCVIIAASRFKTTDIKHILTSKMPIVFAGDFLDGAPAENTCNQIIEDTGERSAFYVNTALNLGYRNIAMIGGDTSTYAGRLMRAGAEKAIEKCEANIRFYPFWSPEEELAEDRIKDIDVNKWKQVLGNIFKDGIPDVLINDPSGKNFILAEALKSLGFELGRDIQVICHRDPFPGMIYLYEIGTELHRSAAEYLKKVFENPSCRFGSVMLSNMMKRYVTKLEQINNQQCHK